MRLHTAPIKRNTRLSCFDLEDFGRSWSDWPSKRHLDFKYVALLEDGDCERSPDN